jgi:hypothetical protein
MFCGRPPGTRTPKGFASKANSCTEFALASGPHDSIRSVPKGWLGRRESTCPDHFRHFPNYSGTPGGIRTPNLGSRNPLLYPVELRAYVHILVPPTRFERVTPSFVGKCSDPLS